MSHFRLHPVWQLTAEEVTPGRSSLTFTWRQRQTPAQSPTLPSAMPPTLFHSQHKGSGVSIPPATCSAHGSQGLVLACSQKRKTLWRGLESTQAPPQSQSLALPPPPRAKLRVPKLVRDAISQLRVITSACQCLPYLRRRTGSLWSLLNTWITRLPLLCRMDWLGAHMRLRGLP